MRPPRRTRRDRCSRSGSRERFDRRDGERGAPNGGARRHAARAAPLTRARPPRRRRRAQPRDRAAPQAGRRDGRRGRRDRAGAFRGRGLTRMTIAVDTVRDTPFVVGGRTLHSRLMVGTGKYRDNETMARAIEAAGAEVVTVAVRRVDLDRSKETGILHHLDPKRFFLLANTAGCFTADDAVRYARLARAAGFNDFVKLEVIGDQVTLLPDVARLLEAARILVKDGFKVLAYTNEDLVTELGLQDAGCAAVMPLAVEAGRAAFLAGRKPRRDVAFPASPTEGMLD